MQVVFFCHSLISDWNHGNAHFLRGVATELMARGHEVRVFEPANNWSLQNLLVEHGPAALEGFGQAYPHLVSHRYDPVSLDLDRALRSADLVLVHEWNCPDLVARLGQHRARGRRYRLLFHDTHHRSVSDPETMRRYDLRHYDGVLAFGEVIRQLYRQRGWARAAWTWHEAADTRIFHPHPDQPLEGDLVWIGNWGDEERTQELHEFLIEPVRRLGLRARAFGVRYPQSALNALAKAGIEYGGWLANHRVPETFGRYRVTVHIPRRFYVSHLPGIPTIRPFEAMACGIPLVCAAWEDTEGLFEPGRDYLVAHNGEEMAEHLRTILRDTERAVALSDHGLQTIRRRHTCTHRVNQLLAIAEELGLDVAVDPAARARRGLKVQPLNAEESSQTRGVRMEHKAHG